jgi:hypothetical protein
MKSITSLFLASAICALVAAGCDDDDTKPSPPVPPRTDGSTQTDVRPPDAAGDGASPDSTDGSGDAPGPDGGSGDAGDGATPDMGSSDGTVDSSGDTMADAAPSPYQPTLFLNLPVTCNTPDGMRIDPRNNNVILSCPNFFAKTSTNPDVYAAPPVLMKITPGNALEPYFSNLPMPPEAPNRAGPMGIDFGPDNHLYYADHQYRFNTDYKSRIVRVNTDTSGAPTSADVVVEGLRLANAVMWSRDFLYVSDTWAYEGADMGKSAIYRFTRAELAAATTANPIRVQRPTATTTDTHLFHQFTTVTGRGLNLAGADGITFDAQGNLITGKFGDGVMTKIAIASDGTKGAVTSPWVNDPKLTCVDGIFFHAASGNVYVADSQKNAIQVVSAAGAVTTLWENDNTTGVGGLLDQPAEPLIRGTDLIIANFDAGFGAPAAGFQPGKNTGHDAPYTLSVIKLQ